MENNEKTTQNNIFITDNTEAQKPKALAWVTSPYGAKSILQKASEISKEENCLLVAISVQGPIEGDWNTRARDLATLEKVSREVGAELIVRFSENQLKSAYEIIQDYKPTLMFTGVPGIGRSSAFIENIRQMADDSKIYMVDKNGNLLNFE